MKVEKSRLGSFFFFVGFVLLAIFFVADRAENPSYGYFIVGAAALFLGGYLWWRNLEPGPESGRFRAWRSMHQKSAERKARKKQKKEDQQAAQE